MAHLEPQARKAFLAGISPGADLDLRGIMLETELLDQVLVAVQQPDGSRIVGDAQFNGAQFRGDARFDSVTFTGYAEFDRAQFMGAAGFREANFQSDARFGDVRFNGAALFRQARFGRDVWFSGAQFQGAATFDGAQFGRDSSFEDTEFDGDAWFTAARFSAPTSFGRAQFARTAEFNKVQFSDEAWFGVARFLNGASFGHVEFQGDAQFQEAQFGGDAWFGEAQFGKHAEFSGAQFGNAWFGEAQFRRTRFLGPLYATALGLDEATFEQAITIEAASAILSCIGTRFDERATLRLRYAEIAIDDAVFTKASSIAFAENTFRPRGEGPTEVPNEDPVTRAANGRSPRPRLLSLRGVDASTLTATALDLSGCLFAGAHNLDRFRLEGPRPFAHTPHGWRFGRVGGQGFPLWRWTRRQALAEEHHWRATRQALPEERWWSSGPLLPAAPSGRLHPKRAGWYPPACQTPTWVTDRTGHPVERLYPFRIASLYRFLRKAQEDSKNEPGAADFYYGEMEMRRKARIATPSGERFLLTLYWLICGYGLRGLRALAWLAVLVVGLGILFELVGFTRHPSPLTIWGSLLYAARSTLSIPDPEALLTGWGKLLQLALRLAGPVLLGLALLAVRNRVKR